MDMIRRDEEVPENGGSRFRGLEIQTAKSNHNAVNILGYSRSTDLKLEVEKANASIDLDVRFRYDNNRANLLRRSDQWPFLYRSVPAVFTTRGFTPTTTQQPTVQKRSTTRRWRRSFGWCTS